MSENMSSSPPMTPLQTSDASSFGDVSVASTDMLPTPTERSAKETRMTRSQLSLSGPLLDDVNDFKRGRTKFTQAQIDALEALFVTHGPHPTRGQRALTAEKINVPPRTVQIFLQNRRQRDVKNRTAAMNAQAAKMDAKHSAVTFPSVDFKFVTPKITDVEGEGNTSMDSSSVLQTGNVNITENSRSSVKTGPVAKRQTRVSRPFATRNVSLDNIAENMLVARRSPFVAVSKENIVQEPVSSPVTGPRMLQKDTTPIKRSPLSAFNTPPAAAALWTRMISSPPTPLSPINRRRSAQFVGGGKCANLSQALELACAKARVSDRPCWGAIPGGNPKQTSLRSRTVSAQKRLREEIENDAPRKRATVTEPHQSIRPAPWTGVDGEYSGTWRVASWRDSCSTLNAGDTSVSDDIVTPDDSITPSSPGVKDISAEMVTSPSQYGNVAKTDVDVLVLAALEANAAFVLASLFTKV